MASGGQVNEGHHDVASSFVTLSPSCQWVSLSGCTKVPNPGLNNAAVVPQEPTTTALGREGEGHVVGTHMRGGWGMHVATLRSRCLARRGPHWW